MLETSVGAHTLAFEEPDLFHIAMRGDVTAAEVVLFSERLGEHARGRGPVFLIVDLSGMGDIPPEARKASAQQGVGGVDPAAPVPSP